MAAHHFPIHQTTAGAPDAIVDWFALFQNWITGTVGWTVVAGGGTTDLVLRSLGEAGGYTMLFVHIWRVGVGNTVRIEVSDDAIPTHETTENGLVDSAGVNPFEFWMTANLEAIIIAWKNAAGCQFIYAGALMPFALLPPDETYHMVATSSLTACSVLRDSGGVWDVDWKTNYAETRGRLCVVSPITGTLPLFGLVADMQNKIAGQYWLISSEIAAAAAAHGDTIESADVGGTSTWIILHDNISAKKFALWTGGVIPTGDPDGTFGSTAGVVINSQDVLDTMAAFLVGLGWADHGDTFPNPAGEDINRLCHSTGEDGTSDIWILLSYRNAPANYFTARVTDGAALTHLAGCVFNHIEASYPTSYIMSGDKDCVVIALQDPATSRYECMWMGKVLPAAPGCPSTYYNMCAGVLDLGASIGRVLRNHDGLWNRAQWFNINDNFKQNSNPSLYDGTTYFVWPNWIGGASYDIGDMKYCGFTSGAVAQGDTITVGAKVYTVLQYSGTPYYWLIRTT